MAVRGRVGMTAGATPPTKFPIRAGDGYSSGMVGGT